MKIADVNSVKAYLNEIIYPDLKAGSDIYDECRGLYHFTIENADEIADISLSDYITETKEKSPDLYEAIMKNVPILTSVNKTLKQGDIVNIYDTLFKVEDVIYGIAYIVMICDDYNDDTFNAAKISIPSDSIAFSFEYDDCDECEDPFSPESNDSVFFRFYLNTGKKIDIHFSRYSNVVYSSKTEHKHKTVEVAASGLYVVEYNNNRIIKKKEFDSLSNTVKIVPVKIPDILDFTDEYIDYEKYFDYKLKYMQL